MILVTGFGPFPGVARNATAEIVEGLNMDKVRTLVLPVKWHVAPELVLRAAREYGASVVLMNGVAAPVQPLFVERGAHSRCGSHADVDGHRANTVRPFETRPMTIDVRKVARVARAEIARAPSAFRAIVPGVKIAPVRKKNDYLCNHTSYEVARAGITCGFLHWPSSLSDDHVITARAVLERVLHALL